MYHNRHINYSDFILPAVLIFCTVLFISGYGRFGLFFIDTSRECYIPMAMNAGEVLYKDIYNVYPPLGYQVNALLFKIFGEHLRTLYFAGFINGIIFICGYFILLKTLFIKSKIIPALITLFIVSVCIFAVSSSNYIFPYSYSMVYAASAFMWALVFLVKYLYKNENKYILLSYFLSGAGISFKAEYVLFVLVLIFVSAFIKKPFKINFYCVLCFLSVPLCSLAVLAAQGCMVSDFFEALNLMITLAKTQSVKYCYRGLGIIPSLSSFKNIIINFTAAVSFLSLSGLILYKILVKIKRKIFAFALIFFFSALCIYALYPVFIESNSAFFCFTGIFDILLILVFAAGKKFNYNSFDKIFLVISVSCVLISVKSICFVTMSNYGNFFLPFLFLPFFIFFLHYIPVFFGKNMMSEKYKTAFIILLLLLIILYNLSNNTRRKSVFPYPVKTERGVIYTAGEAGEAVRKTINYIKENTFGGDKILVLPEGAMINFLTERKTDNRFYYLIPPNIEVFGEDNIKETLKADLPDYIILQSMSYLNFNQTFFCESFGNKICRLIPQYYEYKALFGSDFYLAVYKKRISP